MVAPHLTMFLREDMVHVCARDAHGKAADLSCVAGNLGDTRVLPPPPDSWVSQPDANLAIGDHPRAGSPIGPVCYEHAG